MSSAIRKREIAKTDLLEHALYIAREQPRAARKFLRRAEEATEKLAEFPGMGAVYGLTGVDLADIRFWPISGFRNHLVFYRKLESGGIEVLRVLHGARDIERALRADSGSVKGDP